MRTGSRSSRCAPAPVATVARCVLALAAAIALGRIATAAAEHKLTLDGRHLRVAFQVTGFGLWPISGRFGEARGEVVLDPRDANGGHVDVTAAAASIDTGLPPRDDILRSDAFFAAARHPFLRFRSRRIELLDKGPGEITGDLTMLGVTRLVRLELLRHCATDEPTVTSGGGRSYVKASGVVRRSEWGMTALVPSISDEVQLTIEVELSLRSCRHTFVLAR